jgi:exodeoxyribonuclease VII large subunit
LNFRRTDYFLWLHKPLNFSGIVDSCYNPAMTNPLFNRVEESAIPISELNRRARALLENSFSPLWVSGEISNLTQHASGHWYFSLKDEKAQVRCVMFRHRNQHLDFAPKAGMQVEARVLVSLYEPRGDFQLNVETLRPGGLGALYEAFAKLKARLEAEGLFDVARKRVLPAFPRQIGIITSPYAAALRDVLATLKRRMPTIPVVLYPTPVQGKGASLQIAQAIKTAGMRKECDVLILCRGGGSIEDLREFNEEVVARALVASPIPIICGVGHETDFTIADFAASQRAPTPTAAAELASPNRSELAQRLAAIANRLVHHAARTVETRMQHLDHLAKRLVHPGQRIQHQAGQLAHLRQRLQRAAQYGQGARAWKIQQLQDRIHRAQPNLTPLEQTRAHYATRLALVMSHHLVSAKQNIAGLAANLAHLNPQSTLERGYSIARDEQGRVVRDSGAIQVGSSVELTFAVGTAATKIISISS